MPLQTSVDKGNVFVHNWSRDWCQISISDVTPFTNISQSMEVLQLQILILSLSCEFTLKSAARVFKRLSIFKQIIWHQTPKPHNLVISWAVMANHRIAWKMDIIYIVHSVAYLLSTPRFAFQCPASIQNAFWCNGCNQLVYLFYRIHGWPNRTKFAKGGTNGCTR